MRPMNPYERVLCDYTGTIFVHAQRQGYDVVDFIEKYMRCRVPEVLDRRLYQYGGCGPYYLYAETLDEIAPEKAGEDYTPYPEKVLEWAGYYYRQWNWLNGRPSKEIIEICPAKKMLDSWFYGHTVDITLFVDDMENPDREYPVREREDT